jgi:hypothetical protein
MKISQNEAKEGIKNERLEWKDLISRKGFDEAKQLIDSLYKGDNDGFKGLVVGEAKKQLFKKARMVNADFNDDYLDKLAQSEIGEKILSGNIAFYLEEAAVFLMFIKSDESAGLAYPGEAPLFWYLREFDKDTNFMFIQIKSHHGKRFGIDQAHEPEQLKEARDQYLIQKIKEKIKSNQAEIKKFINLTGGLINAKNAENTEQFLMTNSKKIHKFVEDSFNRMPDKSELDRDTFFKKKVQEQITDKEIRTRQYDQENKSLEKVLKEVNIEQVLNNNHKTLYDQIIAKYKPSIDLKGKPLLLGISQSNLETTQTSYKIEIHKKLLESLGTVSTGKKTIKTSTVIELGSEYLYRHVTQDEEDQQTFKETVNQIVPNHKQPKANIGSNTMQGHENITNKLSSQELNLLGKQMIFGDLNNKKKRKTSNNFFSSDSTSNASTKTGLKTSARLHQESSNFFDSSTQKRSSSETRVLNDKEMVNNEKGKKNIFI